MSHRHEKWTSSILAGQTRRGVLAFETTSRTVSGADMDRALRSEWPRRQDGGSGSHVPGVPTTSRAGARRGPGRRRQGPAGAPAADQSVAPEVGVPTIAKDVERSQPPAVPEVTQRAAAKGGSHSLVGSAGGTLSPPSRPSRRAGGRIGHVRESRTGDTDMRRGPVRSLLVVRPPLALFSRWRPRSYLAPAPTGPLACSRPTGLLRGQRLSAATREPCQPRSGCGLSAPDQVLGVLRRCIQTFLQTGPADMRARKDGPCSRMSLVQLLCEYRGPSAPPVRRGLGSRVAHPPL